MSGKERGNQLWGLSLKSDVMIWCTFVSDCKRTAYFCTNYYYYILHPFNGLAFFQDNPVSWQQKGKPFWILMT